MRNLSKVDPTQVINFVGENEDLSNLSKREALKIINKKKNPKKKKEEEEESEPQSEGSDSESN